jgi:hypothetical protein
MEILPNLPTNMNICKDPHISAYYNQCALILLSALQLASISEHFSPTPTTVSVRLDSLGFKPQWGRDIPYPPKMAQRPIQSPVQWVGGLGSQGMVMTTHTHLVPWLKKAWSYTSNAPSVPTWHLTG